MAVATLVWTDRATYADGFLDFLFGAQPAAPQAQPQVGGGVSFARPRRHHVESGGPDGSGSDGGGGLAYGSKSICVRLCDGYSFPVGSYHGHGDRAAHEATCHAECPGAATALYLTSEGGELADAMSVATNAKYSKLPDAFKYQTSFTAACSCHPPGGSRIKSLLHDFTLRRGDAVMTDAGLKVFHGAARFPYKQTDFVSLARSADVHKPVMAILVAMQRTSLKAETKAKATSVKHGLPTPTSEPNAPGVLTVSAKPR